ncbi:MAG: hypothetical protein H0T42_13290 [Deltaproteobacteria bacterium]|nr:hypothetical protein [Deltaproteobacteria bacterium]
MSVSTTCHVHGASGMAFVCSHIRDALATGTAVPAWSTYPCRKIDDYIVLRMCATCVAQQRLPVPARSIDVDQLDLQKFVTEAICEACFAARASAP